MHELNRLVLNITNGSRAAHAFIIEGPAGESRDSFITSLAMGLECTSPDEHIRPCGRCASCRQILAGTGLDVVRMSKSQGSGKTSSGKKRETYKVPDAADFIERLGMGAYGRFLIGIIDDADTLSEVIQNKLLKTLEEPGADTILILAASNRENLLGTVRSRCSIIRLNEYISADEDAAYEDALPDTASSEKAIAELAAKVIDPECRFYEFRAAMDKCIKSREDALFLLDVLEDDMRRRMAVISGTEPASGLQSAAAVIELCAETGMDIRREMTYGKALKRLFLDLRAHVIRRNVK